MKTLFIKLLNFISISSSYLVVFCILFLFQKYTIGRIPLLKTFIIFNKFYLYEILFFISSIYIIIKYINVYSPYKKYLDK
ncbi:hypothetical protein IYC_14033 [Clostridium sporogenes PA 3679]|nr:hypothetical protein IYC_14033 [Clostridium sporogenes PA 3679]